MARERVVSRTIKVAKVTALCLDTVTAEPENRTVEISASIKGEKPTLNAVRKAVETEDFKVVKIVNVEIEEALYVMPEAEFIAKAHKVEK